MNEEAEVQTTSTPININMPEVGEKNRSPWWVRSGLIVLFADAIANRTGVDIMPWIEAVLPFFGGS